MGTNNVQETQTYQSCSCLASMERSDSSAFRRVEVLRDARARVRTTSNSWNRSFLFLKVFFFVTTFTKSQQFWRENEEHVSVNERPFSPTGGH